MTSTKQELLRWLKAHTGQWVSGERISRQLGISRTAIWKHIKTLKQEGHEIDSAPKRGYCLTRSADRMDAEEIRASLQTRIMGRSDIAVFEATDSTNQQAKTLATNGAAEGTLVVADTQTHGRGRRRRTWFSPPGHNIYASIILRPPMAPAQAPQITLMTAVAAARTLIETAGLAATIKWPNDILVHGKKIAGILTEISTEMDQVDYVVVGMGINVHTTREQMPRDIAATATSVDLETDQRLSRTELLCALLQHFETCYRQLLREGFVPIMDQWRQLTDIIGSRVYVDVLQSRYTGVVQEVDDDGVLVLKDDQGRIRRIFSGDVSRCRKG